MSIFLYENRIEDSPQKQAINLSVATDYSNILVSPGVPGGFNVNNSYNMSSDEFSSPQPGFRGIVIFFKY